MKRVIAFAALSLSIITTACEPAAEKLPSAPEDVASVAAMVKGKKFGVKKVGLASTLPSNSDRPSVDWIDTTTSGEFEKQADAELKNFSIEFQNDTSVGGYKRREEI